MSLRLRLVNLALRVTVKRKLARLATPPEMRALFERQAAHWLRGPADAHVIAERIPRDPDAAGAQGGWIGALWCAAGRPDRHRVILYLHGGAFIAGSSATHWRLAAALGQAAGARVLVPDYRLAPEHPLPAATDDALAAYRFLLGRGIAPGRIALAGDSAGGGLAFLLASRIEREGLPPPAAIVGFSPWTDLGCTGESLVRNARRDPMLPASRVREASQLARGPRPPDDAEASALHAPLAAPPPCLIFAGRDEILVDDARAMARVLGQAGGDVRLEIWPRVPHGWPLFVGWLPEAASALALAGTFIARHTPG